MAEERPPPPPPPDRATALGGFWVRAGALLIDLLITWFWAVPFGAVMRGATGDPVVLGPLRLSSLIVLAVFWAYLVVTTATAGGTLGKLALGLRVVTTGYERPDWATVLFREVVGRILVTASLGIGYLWVAADPRKQGWHDRLADTVVLRRVRLVPAVDPWERAAHQRR